MGGGRMKEINSSVERRNRFSLLAEFTKRGFSSISRKIGKDSSPKTVTKRALSFYKESQDSVIWTVDIKAHWRMTYAQKSLKWENWKPFISVTKVDGCERITATICIQQPKSKDWMLLHYYPVWMWRKGRKKYEKTLNSSDLYNW